MTSNPFKILAELARISEYKLVTGMRRFAASHEYAQMGRGSFTPGKAARLIKREGQIEHLHSVINDYPLAQERLRELEIQAIMEYHYRLGSELRESILDELFTEEIVQAINGECFRDRSRRNFKIHESEE